MKALLAVSLVNLKRFDVVAACVAVVDIAGLPESVTCGESCLARTGIAPVVWVLLSIVGVAWGPG
jgi:hypothetical protein